MAITQRYHSQEGDKNILNKLVDKNEHRLNCSSMDQSKY